MAQRAQGAERTPTGLDFTSVRRNNLAAVLGAVHYGGQVTRAELSRSTGLNRSTVMALAGELRARGLINEFRPEATPNRGKGRPSTILAPNRDVCVFVAHIDVASVEAAVVALGGEVIARTYLEREEPVTSDEVGGVLAGMLEALRADLPPEARVLRGSVSLAALVTIGGVIVRHAPQLGWHDVPLAELACRALGFPVEVTNDAIASAVAEMRFGAARAWSDVLYIHGADNGISCAIFNNGTPLLGTAGYAGHMGHNLVSPPHGTAGRITGRTVDDEVNRRALLKTLGWRSATDDEIENALRYTESDQVRATARRQTEVLSLVIANVVNMLNPQGVVLNGFLAALYGSDPKYLTTLVKRQSLPPNHESLQLTRASLGGDAVVVGTAECALAPLLESADLDLLRLRADERTSS